MKRTTTPAAVRWFVAGLLAVGALALTGCTSDAPTATWREAGTGGSGGGTGEEVVQAQMAAATTNAQAPSQIIKTTGGTAVALTFDDGPSNFTPQILALLRQHNVKATFCLVGSAVKAYPDMVRAIVADGHTLCNHTWNHDLNLGKKAPEAIRADLQRTIDEIHLAVPGVPVKYFRHPGGNFTPAAVKVAAELGMVSAGWEVDTRDWDTSHGAGQTLTNSIVTVVRQHTRPGSIVLAHDAGGDRQSTIAAFRTLLPELKSKFTLQALPA